LKSKRQERTTTRKSRIRVQEQRPDRESAASATQKTPLLTALTAGVCWAAALSLLLLGNLRAERDPLSPQRLLFYALVLAAGLLTFVPIQQQMRLPHLGVEGVGGTALLLYTLAFVPPPNDWLLSLPEVPVYCLFIAALFWSTASITVPFIYAVSQRIFKQRARQMDLLRVRRHSYEIAGLVAGIAVLAGLRVLTWVSLLLLAMILFTAELLFLSQTREQHP
jgi:hypothetical protein